MSVLDLALASGRAAAEERMRDTVRLYLQGDDVFNRTTGATEEGPKTTLYEGKARVKRIAQATGEEREAGEREVVLRDYEVHLPWASALTAAPRVLPGARVAVLASRDTRMVGQVLWVIGSEFSDQVTAWRISVEDRS
ncbi:DUF6093 family protein [Streptomyces phaeochromogenes]|uniref:DUF6093 family protein n=1 Tax=Streptomyces phaeochromogenes TaxID=1923 RepID=UPI00225B0766|nr:DUF6093 family protein [Streptomyces phaeochromogenes]MCX5601623.1 DUF6093 family protein [Streptomyces phaeochromogenes]